jgi:hypothetical protein
MHAALPTIVRDEISVQPFDSPSRNRIKKPSDLLIPLTRSIFQFRYEPEANLN